VEKAEISKTILTLAANLARRAAREDERLDYLRERDRAAQERSRLQDGDKRGAQRGVANPAKLAVNDSYLGPDRPTPNSGTG